MKLSIVWYSWSVRSAVPQEGEGGAMQMVSVKHITAINIVLTLQYTSLRACLS
jgi:hypothetical protein